MSVHSHISWNFFKMVTLVLMLHLLARMTLGNNEIYRLGVSFGETLRSTDDDLDPKDLDYELQELAEQMGVSPEVIKLLGSENFVDGAVFGYYKPEILEEES
jgi:hypothetical protein